MGGRPRDGRLGKAGGDSRASGAGVRPASLCARARCPSRTRLYAALLRRESVWYNTPPLYRGERHGEQHTQSSAMSCGPTHVPRAGLLVTGHCVWNSRRRLPHWALRHTSVLPAFAVISWRSCRALKSLYFRRILKAWGPAYWMLWHWANPSWLRGLVVSRKPCRRSSTGLLVPPRDPRALADAVRYRL